MCAVCSCVEGPRRLAAACGPGHGLVLQVCVCLLNRSWHVAACTLVGTLLSLAWSPQVAPAPTLLPCLCSHHRSLAQLLLVVDDGDLHQRQTPFSLGASRAIASTLNSLVFHTAFPEQDGAQQQQQRPGQQLLQQAGALREASAAVLPATLGHGMVRTHTSCFLMCRTTAQLPVRVLGLR